MKNYFQLSEFLRSTKARALGIDNLPSFEVVDNLRALRDNVLNPLREEFGQPIIVTSGYRCARLNAAVGGVANSQHLIGQAADIKAGRGGIDANRTLFALIQRLNLPFDQLISEYNYSWIHVSYSPRHRRQILFR
jgi:hypothetical protein